MGQSTNQDLKIISASDFGCSLLAQDNIKQIIDENPNLFIVPGDLGYDKDGACWFKEMGVLDGITMYTYLHLIQNFNHPKTMNNITLL